MLCRIGVSETADIAVAQSALRRALTCRAANGVGIDGCR